MNNAARSLINDINLARMSPAGFALYASKGKWKLARHLAYVNRKLLDVAGGRIKRLLINFPPRHGKSELISKFLPVWWLGTFPDHRILFASYESSFAAQFGAVTRDLFDEFAPTVFGLKLKEGSQKMSQWGIENHDGSLTTTGVGGPLTGRGGNLLLLDDLIKNNEEAESLVMREKLWNWFGQTAYTRLQPDGAIILICTRWHQDDIVGRLLEQEKSGGEKWEKIIFPAIAEEDEPIFPNGLGRKKGEALWPEQWSIEKLRQIRDSGSLSSYGFASLYQQTPVPSGGGMFKKEWFKYFEEQNDYYILKGRENEGDYSRQFITKYSCYKFVTVDTADKVKETSDKTGIAIWGVTPSKDLLLLASHYDRYNYDQILSLLMEINKMWQPEYIGIENKGIAIQLIIEARNRGLAIRALEPEGKGKQNRANMPLGAVVRMEAGKIYFKKDACYQAEVEKQLLFFPKGIADEFVDLIAYAANELTKQDMYQANDFRPYSIEDNLSIGLQKPGNINVGII